MHCTRKGIDNPFNTSGCEWLLFVCRGCLRCVAWFSYWFGNLGFISEGNTYATLLHHPFLFKGKPTYAQEVARRISGTVAGEICAQVNTYQVPITNSYPSHYIIFHLPLVFLSPTSPLSFYSPFFVHLFLARSLVCLCDHVSSICRHLRLLKIY